MEKKKKKKKRCRRKKKLESLNSSLKNFYEQVDRSQKKEPTHAPDILENAESGRAVPAAPAEIGDNAKSSSQPSEENRILPVPPETKNDPEVAEDSSELIATSPPKKKDTGLTRNGERDKHKSPKQSEVDEHGDEVKKDRSKEIKLPKKQDDSHEAMTEKPSKQLDVKDRQAEVKKDSGREMNENLKSPKKEDSKQSEVRDLEALKKDSIKEIDLNPRKNKDTKSTLLELPKKKDGHEEVKDRFSKQQDTKYDQEEVERDNSKEMIEQLSPPTSKDKKASSSHQRTPLEQPKVEPSNATEEITSLQIKNKPKEVKENHRKVEPPTLTENIGIMVEVQEPSNAKDMHREMKKGTSVTALNLPKVKDTQEQVSAKQW